MLGTWKFGRAGHFQLCRYLYSSTNCFGHERVIMLPSIRQQCAPAEDQGRVSETEVAEAVSAWKKGTSGVPKPRKRVHPM